MLKYSCDQEKCKDINDQITPSGLVSSILDLIVKHADFLMARKYIVSCWGVSYRPNSEINHMVDESVCHFELLRGFCKLVFELRVVHVL